MKHSHAEMTLTTTMTVPGLVSILVLLAHTAQGQALQTCEYDVDLCGCKTDKGLISLKKYESKGLAVVDSSQSPKAEYHWNPCKDIDIGITTAACILAYPPLTYDCGSHASTSSSVKDGVAVFHLRAAVDTRQSEIKCICQPKEEFKFIREHPSGYYYLELGAEACCPGGSAGGNSSKGLSAGTVLLIVFFCLVVVYFMAGIAVQIGLKQREGRERIPNVTFWIALPGLIKDGVRFTFSGGKYPSYGEV